MQVKDIEGYVVRPGETLVIVPNHPVLDSEVKRVGEFCKARGFNIMVLPPQAKVYVVAQESGDAPAGNA